MQDSHIHIGSLYQLFLDETQPFRKVHRMIDLFESIIKSHSVVILSEYVNHNQLSEAAKGMLSVGLRTPSLGTWQLFARVLFEELKVQGYEWSFADFPDDFTALDKALKVDITNVIAFRNSYAHGATPTDEQCKADVHKFEPFLIKLLSSKWLLNTVTEFRDGKVWISSKSKALCAHPLLVHKSEDGAPIAFFNDLKNDKVGLLNYPLSKHYREKEFFKEFHEYLPLNEWKKTGNSDFLQRIEELTETFKGRLAERSQIHHFVLSKSKGYLSIQGNPGIGKSALIAQVFKEIKSSNEAKQIYCIEYFIRRGTQQADVDYLLNYLIKRTDEVFSQGREIRAEGKMTFDLQNQLFSKWRLWAEHSQGKKLLFLIDGLDEGVEKNVLTYMPRENFENILIIYGSRPGGHKSIDELWSTLPPEHHICLQLKGLSIADIRALIYDVANKYELERESVWVDAVQQRSQGNPLYLRLLCNAIENGSIALNDLNALPKEIDEYYKAILSRYAQDMIDGDALLAGLFTFAAAKDYLTMAHLGLINQLGDATVQRIGSTLKEVLYENPLTDGVLDYQLFHESFREYLVKEKAKKVNDAAERILDFCASWDTLEGAWEQRYALEHYASHLNESKKEVREKELRAILENNRYKETQKKVLKKYDASRDLARIGLLKAADLKQFDLQLECALQLVDLKYEEANDAPQVVALVADGEIDLALKRIESFGGADKEGVKLRFILYMLCLIELTLLDSKTKPHRKSSISKMLQHLDEQIPVDHSILAWNYFFPSYTMFLMSCEWADLGLDYWTVYKRTDDWETDWLIEKGPYNDIQFEVLLTYAMGISDKWAKSSALKDISTEQAKQGKLEAAAAAMQEALTCARGISDESYKSSALKDISTELARQGKVEEALTCARGISDESYKSSALEDISTELAKQGKLEAAAAAMQEALTCAMGINDEWAKSRALKDISTELAKQGKVEDAASVMQDALTCAMGMSSGGAKSSALKGISTELAKQGKLEEALTCARGISDDRAKSSALKGISTELAKQGKVEEALACARGISSKRYKSSALEDISTELAKQGKLEEALTCAMGISDEWYKSRALKGISTELAKQGKVEDAASVMQDALTCLRGISSERYKSSALEDISTELAKQGKLEEALTCAMGINDEWAKSRALKDISTELAKQGKLEEALTCAMGMSSGEAKSSAPPSLITQKRSIILLKGISTELAKQGKVEDAASVLQDALTCAMGISDERAKSSALKDISTELAKQGKVEEAASAMQEAHTCAMGISDESDKSSALKDISTEQAKQGKLEAAAAAMQEALTCAMGMSSFGAKSRALKDISTELAKQGKLEEALTCAMGMSSEWYKSSALEDISTELAKQGKLEEALTCAMGINDEWAKSRALKDISTELAKQGKVEEALTCARGISDDRAKSSALKGISTELGKQGKVEDAASAMQDALTCARGISDESDKSSALKVISTEQAKQGNWHLAETTGLEIPQLAERHNCWETIAKNHCKENGWQKALQQVNPLQNDEARLFYLKGWTEAINQKDAHTACVQEALSQLANDSKSIEILLQKHALHEVFFDSANPEKKKQLNHTLNIQWAIDIAAQFPKDNSAQRLSKNVEDWINEIADEDDRDQIELWAKQVVKGKITEEEFGRRVSEI